MLPLLVESQDIRPDSPRNRASPRREQSVARSDTAAHPSPTISTHVLDLETGAPAAGVNVVLFRRGDDEEFEVVSEGETNADGRISDLVNGKLIKGDYQLLFDLAEYRDEDAFLQGLAVALRITDSRRSYHVPLLLSPYGASVYRGS